MNRGEKKTRGRKGIGKRRKCTPCLHSPVNQKAEEKMKGKKDEQKTHGNRKQERKGQKRKETKRKREEEREKAVVVFYSPLNYKARKWTNEYTKQGKNRKECRRKDTDPEKGTEKGKRIKSTTCLSVGKKRSEK